VLDPNTNILEYFPIMIVHLNKICNICEHLYAFLTLLIIDIEMGRLVTGAENPTVLYVSGGNTQVRVLDSILTCSSL